MAKILTVTQDIPVLTTRRNTLPALGWPALSALWQRSTRAIWPGGQLALNDLIANEQHLSFEDQLTMPLMVGDTIHVVITDTKLWALQPEILRLITRHPYQNILIHLLVTDQEATAKIGGHHILAGHLRSETAYHNRHHLLKPLFKSLAFNFWQPSDVVLYARQDFVDIEPQAGVKYRPYDIHQDDNGPLLLTHPKHGYQFSNAVTAGFTARLDLAVEEAEQSSSNRAVVLIIEPLRSSAADQHLSETLQNLASWGHEVNLISVSQRQRASHWPLMAIHLPASSPTHLEALQNGPVVPNEIIDYINDYVYDRNVPRTRLSQIFTPVRAHSSVG